MKIIPKMIKIAVNKEAAEQVWQQDPYHRRPIVNIQRQIQQYGDTIQNARLLQKAAQTPGIRTMAKQKEPGCHKKERNSHTRNDSCQYKIGRAIRRGQRRCMDGDHQNGGDHSESVYACVNRSVVHG